MNKYSRLGKNTVLVFIGNMGSKIISVIMLPFYTSWLSQADYGTTDLISVYVFFLTGLITCCLPEAIFRFPKDRDKSVQSEYFSSGIAFSVGLFAVALLAVLVVKNMFDPEHFFAKYAFVIYLMILAGFLQSYTQQFTRSIDKMAVYVSSGVVSTLLMVALSFILIPSKGVEGYIMAQLITYFATTAYTILAGRIDRYVSWRAVKKDPVREMLKYSLPLIPNSIIWWVISASNRFFIEQNNGMDELGIFAVANKFPSLLALLFNVFFYSWQISVLEEFGKEGFKSFYNRVFSAVFSFLVIITAVISLGSYYMVHWFADDKFISAWQLVPVLTIAAFVSCLATFVGVNFLATKQSQYFFSSGLWGAGTALVFNFILIPRWGLFGAALSMLIANVIILICRIFKTHNLAPLENPIRYVVMLLVSVAIAMEVIFIENPYLKTVILIFSVAALAWTCREDYRLIAVELKHKFFKNKNR